MDQHRSHPDALRTRELVVRAVTHEESLARLDDELAEREPIDPWVRLSEPAGTREDLCIDEPGERRLLPDVGHVFAADGDQAGADLTTAQLLQRFDDAIARPLQDAAR